MCGILGGVGLDVAVLERVRAVWRLRLGAPGAFRRPGVHLHIRHDDAEDATAAGDSGAGWWVVAVALGDATCLSVPAGAARLLRVPRVTAGDHPRPDGGSQPRDVAAAGGPPDPGLDPLLDVTGGPVAEVLGPAVLLYGDPARLVTGPAPPEVGVGGVAEVAALAAGCPAGDRDESGILEVTSRLWVWRRRDHRGAATAVAACGYQVWDGELGHLSVLVHPAWRGRGLGRAVAAAAVTAAVAEGLVPQWRVRTGLAASLRIARSLGLQEVGWQALYRLARPPAQPGPQANASPEPA